MKGGYNHFMEKEIFEQADTIAQTMQGRVKVRVCVARVWVRMPGWQLADARGLPACLPCASWARAQTPTSRPPAPPPSSALPWQMTPLSPMKYSVPGGLDPYMMPRVRLGGLVDHTAVSALVCGVCAVCVRTRA